MTAEIRTETAGDRARRAKPRPQEPISGPHDRLPAQSHPEICSAQPLDFLTEKFSGLGGDVRPVRLVPGLATG
jgi:hypothetical protein